MAEFVRICYTRCSLCLLTLLCFINLVQNQDTGECRNRACYPLSEDLLQNLPNRTITASSTCGEPPENYELRFAGQFADTYQVNVCNASDPGLSHITDNLYDFTSQNLFGNIYTRPRLDTWWQSGNLEQNIYLSVTFGDSFLFQETILSFRSVRPLSIKIEKSTNFGRTWLPLHYYAQFCGLSFPEVPRSYSGFNVPFCEQRYYYGDSTTAAAGENIQKVEYSPAGDLGQSFYRQNIMEYFSMTDFRIILAQTGVSAPATRSYFAVADWAVTGQCLCFGHALECTGPNRAECVCQHNTQGVSCQECKPLYNNRPWATGNGANENACEDCGCNGFATSCIYDQAKGFGVCQDCTDNTAGDKCEKCVNDYYRNPNYTNDIVDNGNSCIDELVPYPCSQYCWPCECNATGSMENSVCNEEDGQCQCKFNVGGRMCDDCKDTFFNLNADNPVGCQECDCDPAGTLGSTNFCDKQTGQCICKTNVMGARCDTCIEGTFNLDVNNTDGCTACKCDIGGSVSGQCTDLGGCNCRPNLTGMMCDLTLPGFFVPKMDGIMYEAEFAANTQDIVIDEVPIDLDASDNITSSHTGRGFMVVSPNAVLTFTDIRIPRIQRYAVVLRYISTSTWIGISVILSPQTPAPYFCHEVSMQGEPVTLIGQITPAVDGGAAEFHTSTLPCLNIGLYDVTVSFTTSSGGSSDTLLLDSLVLLPKLEDLDITTSLETPADTRQAMQECWDAAIMAHNPMRDTKTCIGNEFSVMAVAYSGAKECSCESVGTMPNTQCDSHGGQCQCLSGVLGRSCDACAANHYGYDSSIGCTACNCDVFGSVKLSCNHTSGDCECKPNVVGAKCDVCMPEYFGLATGNGCQLCTCNPVYSLNNQCDDSGQCSCKPGVSGLNCDQCASGFFNLTTDGCSTCGCNFDGITEDAGCDEIGQCVCRSEATGEQCDTCPPDTYGFGPWSERGCLSCYCSSHTSNCTEAAGWVEASIFSRFSLTDSGAVLPRWTGMDRDTNTTIDVEDVPVLSVIDPRLILEIVDPSNLTSLFFVSPESYHGDKRTSYGQMFIFTLSQSATSDFTNDPDGDVFIYSRYAELPIAASLSTPSGDQETMYELKLHENYWRKGTVNGEQLTMQEMIQVLAGISSIQIRAKYTTLPKKSVFLHNAELQFAVDITAVDDTALVSDIPAVFVEMCNCPTEYAGNFCELCAPGYRWQSTELGPFSGCIPCDCNGHSDLSCDLKTGACQSCLHNTAGDMCEECLDGYYGDATGGTEGDCQPCMCPGPPGANSFAAICDNNGNCAECAEGHTGNNCEICVTGYYGVPTDIQNNGGRCQPCFCSRSPADCDSVSGQCQNCIGNTGGLTCDVCDTGYWGKITNCQACDCDLVGGEGSCTQDQGICNCFPNVMGNRCDQCMPNSWGFDTGEDGCTACDCHPLGTVFGASQCNLVTGQCDCKERVIGLKCDACTSGYWNVQQGCIPCECNIDGTLASTCDENGTCTCEVNTGQCTCMLETIAGRTCDQCGRVGEDSNVVEEVFVGTYPNCEPCPECYQNWRNTLEGLGANFVIQQQTLMDLLANYGSLTVTEVDQTLEYIWGNLSYAERAIQEGTKEAGDLESIKQGFQEISMSVAEFTVLIEAVEARNDAQAEAVEEIEAFDGNVQVEPGTTRNAAQLQRELDSLVNTQETVYQLANGSWYSIQEMYQLVENQELQIQTLQVLVDKLLDDTERAANERRDARNIITNEARNVEFDENAQRLRQIDTIQRDYSLGERQALVLAAQIEMQLANASAEAAMDLVKQKKAEAQTTAYQTKVARYNATAAEDATTNAQSAAKTYKDVALSTKQKITDLYVEVLDINRRLKDAENQNALTTSTSLLIGSTNVPPPANMATLVAQINAIGVNSQEVQAYEEDATAGLNTAEETRNISQQAQMESASVDALISTIENEITQADVIRGQTVMSLDMSNDYIANINGVAQQVTTKSEVASVLGHSTSDDISTIRQDAQANEQCLISKKHQAENAQGRAQSAKLQAESAQLSYAENIREQEVLRHLIQSERGETTASYQSVKQVADTATALYESVISTKQMEDLDALISQYIRQRNEMQQLTNTLDSMETDLEAIVANLEGADSGGSIRCNG